MKLDDAIFLYLYRGRFKTHKENLSYPNPQLEFQCVDDAKIYDMIYTYNENMKKNFKNIFFCI